MKPTKDIQRDIRSRHGRSSGDQPVLGRVSRMRSLEVGGSGRRRSSRGGRSSRSGYDSPNPARRKLLFGWSIVLGLLALAVIVGTISLWLRPQMQRRSELAMKSLQLPEAKVRVVSRFPSPSEADALRFVKQALANRDPAKVDELFHPGSAKPAEVIEFCSAMETRDGPVQRYDWLSSIDVKDMLVEGVLVVSKGKEKPAERLAFLTPDSQGNWKVDFDAFARSVSPSWDVLLGKGADHGVVRVFVAKDYYFNGPFRDEAEWVCYGIASPDIDELLRGYCRVGSPQEMELEKLFSDGERIRRVTLDIRKVKDAGARQFEITRVLATDWVMARLNGESS